jgi:hypothetical protein
MSGDVLSKAQFEHEWRARTKLAKTTVPAPRATLTGVPAQEANTGEVLKALARPLLAAALEALLEFDAVDYQPRSRRRIQRK